ncbi:hypothetical protein C8R43DRAFT_1110022 [Mycena crocata]|nr:hypothetical protein C8R43DRAFT_1110022 [Mycena crocata]
MATSGSSSVDPALLMLNPMTNQFFGKADGNLNESEGKLPADSTRPAAARPPLRQLGSANSPESDAWLSHIFPGTFATSVQGNASAAAHILEEFNFLDTAVSAPTFASDVLQSHTFQQCLDSLGANFDSELLRGNFDSLGADFDVDCALQDDYPFHDPLDFEDLTQHSLNEFIQHFGLDGNCDAEDNRHDKFNFDFELEFSVFVPVDIDMAFCGTPSEDDGVQGSTTWMEENADIMRLLETRNTAQSADCELDTVDALSSPFSSTSPPSNNLAEPQETESGWSSANADVLGMLEESSGSASTLQWLGDDDASADADFQFETTAALSPLCFEFPGVGQDDAAAAHQDIWCPQLYGGSMFSTGSRIASYTPHVEFLEYPPSIEFMEYPLESPYHGSPWCQFFGSPASELPIPSTFTPFDSMTTPSPSVPFSTSSKTPTPSQAAPSSEMCGRPPFLNLPQTLSQVPPLYARGTCLWDNCSTEIGLSADEVLAHMRAEHHGSTQRQRLWCLWPGCAKNAVEIQVNGAHLIEHLRATHLRAYEVACPYCPSGSRPHRSLRHLRSHLWRRSDKK